MNKIIIFTIFLILTVSSSFLSYERKYTFEIETDTVVALGIPTDGSDDILIYDLQISNSGLNIGGFYFENSTDFNLFLQSFSFSSDSGDFEKIYSNFDWTSFLEVKATGEESFSEKFFGKNGTVEEEEEEEIVVEISATTTITTETVDGAVKAKFTLNPKTGYVGVLDITQNDLKFDFQINLAKLQQYTSSLGNSGIFTLNAILQTDQILSEISEDSETISFPLIQNNEYKNAAANLIFAKKWDCSDSTIFQISSTSISPSLSTGNYLNAYSVSWSIKGNFNSDAVCVWDPVVDINENRTYTPSEFPVIVNPGSPSNKLAIALGVFFSLFAVAVIIVVVYILYVKKESSSDYYDVR